MKKILVVEDEEITRTIIKTCLSARFDIDEAADGKIALELIKQIDYDLVLTDIVMPRMTGTELANIVNIINPKLPFIILSSRSSEYLHYRSEFPNVKIWIEKPFKPTILIGMVDGIFGGHLDQLC